MGFEKHSSTATKTFLRKGRTNGRVAWIPDAGIILSGDSDLIHHMHDFCSATAVPDIEIVSQEETTAQTIGKNDRIVYEGKKIDPFEITFQGNSVASHISCMGLDGAVNPGVEIDPEIEQSGTLVIFAFETGKGSTIRRTDIYANMKARVVKAPAMGAGEQTATVSFRSDNPVAVSVGSGHTVGAEIWFVDANNTNAAATGTALTLGSGNRSGSVTPTAIQVMPKATAAINQYMLAVKRGTPGAMVDVTSDCTLTSSETVLNIPSNYAGPERVTALYVTTWAAMPANADLGEGKDWETLNP